MRLDQNRIRTLVAERGWNLSELLEHAGVSRNAYYSLGRKPSVLPSSLVAIAETLGTAPGAFLIDEEPAAVWGDRLWAQVKEIGSRHHRADQDNIRHTLILLDEKPIERLRRALRRGGA